MDLLRMNEKLTKYVAPEVFVLPTDAPAVLCESPKPGGNESLVYEEW